MTVAKKLTSGYPIHGVVKEEKRTEGEKREGERRLGGSLVFDFDKQCSLR